MTPPSDPRRRARTFVVLMGVVAMFGDMTYEGARSLVGPYLGLLGASAATIGFAAGLGEFLGYGLRLFSGWFADRARAWWPLVLLGYGLNLIAVPGLAFVGHWQAAVALLVLERIGKAIRSPARSTLVSYAASQVGVGWSFGLDEALDQIGAVSGPLLAAFAIWVARAEPIEARYRLAFVVLMLPVVANLALAFFARHTFPTPEDFEGPSDSANASPPALFWAYTAAAGLLALGFSDWALVAFHASRTGLLDLSLLPVLYAAVMGADAVAALGFGIAFDRFGVGVLAACAVCSSLFAPLVFFAPSPAVMIAGALAWGVCMGGQDATFKAVVAKLVPKERRSRAYGLFFACFGAAWWVGSTGMGLLYEASMTAMVAFSVGTQLAAAAGFLWLGLRMRPTKR